VKPLAVALATLLAVSACAHGSSTGTTESATAAPATGGSRPASAPAATASPVPKRQPLAPIGPGTAAARPSSGSRASAAAAAATASAAHTASPVGHVMTPAILGASVSPTVVHSGSVVGATVTTTPDVVSVTAFAGGTSLAVPRVGPGLFRGSTTLPPLPPFAHGGYAVTFVARDAHGATTQMAVGVTVR
jgi:hypothetical protein